MVRWDYPADDRPVPARQDWNVSSLRGVSFSMSEAFNADSRVDSQADGPFDGLRPARLAVGIISAGRVGTAMGVALEAAGHFVVACSAVSDASRRRAEEHLPESQVLPAQEVASRAELLILAVPDYELAPLVSGLAATGSVRSGTIVVHTSGANGDRKSVV